ncbi:MAG TPA: hypothetical protein DCY42_11570 [Chloroflexi bacterium]|nr:hypothetical protein [Chloroflexota bacterium]
MLPSEVPSRQGELLANIVIFGRMLRQLGFRVSADQITDLAESLNYISVSQKTDFYHTARCIFVRNPSQIELFSKAFDLFWAGQIEGMLKYSPTWKMRSEQPPDEDPSAEAEQTIVHQSSTSNEETMLESGENASSPASYSPLELLRYKDFSEYDKDELEKSSRLIRDLVIHLKQRLTQRRVRANKRVTYLDLQRSIRRSSRHGFEILELSWQRRKPKPRPLVLLCDISGSMEQYSRIFLHFMYGLVQNSRQIESFVFASHLSRITPALRYQDIDTVLTQMGKLVTDWAGGTRIGQSLKSFNYEWGRRVLRQGAAVIIISDGWDRGNIRLLEHQMARLKRSTSQLIWLNPLLGAEDYQPLVRGMRAALPYIDSFLPAHNLDSLERLAYSLGKLESL